MSENSNGPKNPTDYCESLCQKEQSSAHFGLAGPTTTSATSTLSTISTSTSTDTAASAIAMSTIAAASMSVAMTTSTATGGAGGGTGKADSMGMSEGGPIGGKGKERHQEGQGRDSGSTVMVHGAMHSLDLVALICYSKIKMKFTGSHV